MSSLDEVSLAIARLHKQYNDGDISSDEYCRLLKKYGDEYERLNSSRSGEVAPEPRARG